MEGALVDADIRLHPWLVRSPVQGAQHYFAHFVHQPAEVLLVLGIVWIDSVVEADHELAQTIWQSSGDSNFQALKMLFCLRVDDPVKPVRVHANDR
jgi:hypothetical protein